MAPLLPDSLNSRSVTARTGFWIPGRPWRFRSALFLRLHARHFMINVRCLVKKVPAAKTFLIAWIFMVSGLILLRLEIAGHFAFEYPQRIRHLIRSVEKCACCSSAWGKHPGHKVRGSRKTSAPAGGRPRLSDEQIRSMRLELELQSQHSSPFHAQLDQCRDHVDQGGSRDRGKIAARPVQGIETAVENSRRKGHSSMAKSTCRMHLR